MPFYRKLPIVVEARQIDMTDHDEALDIVKWSGANVVGDGTEVGLGIAYLPDDAAYDAVMAIGTLEGVMYANDGDWIIKGANGEFYPCKPEAFAKTFEPNGLGQPSPGNHGGNLWS